MSDELKNVYKNAGKLDRYHGETVPEDLFRGRKIGSSVDLMQPTLLGFYRRAGPRLPDVLATDSKGQSPQFKNADKSELIVDNKLGTFTEEMVRNSDKYMVRGCRTIKGDYRGVSVFDVKNTRLRNFDWYKLAGGTDIPPGLACTRDADLGVPSPIHHTIAPKDDMPLSLFLKQLQALAKSAIKD
jgi:hypothetical protein